MPALRPVLRPALLALVPMLLLAACEPAPSRTPLTTAEATSREAHSATPAHAAAVLPEVIVHKSPSCVCCGAWITHMEAAGFRVTVRNTDDLLGAKTRLGVPASIRSCHTSEVGGYVVEGHVPADLIQQLVASRAPVAGIGVNGMPAGSPGMPTGASPAPAYEVLQWSPAGGITRYALRTP